MTHRWTHVLFDMDGTLLNSGDSIMGRLARTLIEFDVPVPDRSELQLMLGPTTPEVLSNYLPDTVIAEATAYYRGLAEADGMTGFSLFEGIRELLLDLRAAGIPCATATLKHHSDAARVLNHFEIGHLFSSVAGFNPERGITTKAQVVASALTDLGCDGRDTPLLVGDRVHDVHGAARNGVPTVLCSWGYGEEKEGLAALAVAATVPELRGLVLP